MTDQSLIGTTAKKTFFDISKFFKVVPRPIFRADSKSGIHFFIRLKLGPSLEKRSANDLRKHIGTRTLHYEVGVLQYRIRGVYTVVGKQIPLG
jgi:hypothetical protein